MEYYFLLSSPAAIVPQLRYSGRVAWTLCSTGVPLPSIMNCTPGNVAGSCRWRAHSVSTPLILYYGGWRGGASPAGIGLGVAVPIQWFHNNIMVVMLLYRLFRGGGLASCFNESVATAWAYIIAMQPSSGRVRVWSHAEGRGSCGVRTATQTLPLVRV